MSEVNQIRYKRAFIMFSYPGSIPWFLIYTTYICYFCIFFFLVPKQQSFCSKWSDKTPWLSALALNFTRQWAKAQLDNFAYCHSNSFKCGGQQDHNIKNASFVNDGPQGKGMKGYFELSLKMIDSAIAFDTWNQHWSTQIKTSVLENRQEQK